MSHVFRSAAITLALTLALLPPLGGLRSASGQPPDAPRESAWRVVRKEGSRMAVLSPDGARLAYAEDRSLVLINTGRGDVLFRSDETRFEVSAVAMSADASKLVIVRMSHVPPFFAGVPLKPDPNPRIELESIIRLSTLPLPFRGVCLQADPNRSEGGWKSIGRGWGMVTEQLRRSLTLGSTVPRRTDPVMMTHAISIPPLSSSVEVWDVARKVRLGASPNDGRPLIAAAFDTEAAKLHAIGVDLRRAEIAVGRPDAAVPAVGEVKPHVFALVDTGPAPMTSFSADGRRAATLRAATSDGRISIAIWKGDGASPTLMDPPASVPPRWVVSVAPDGKRFVTAGVGNRIQIWDFDRSAIERTIINGEEAVPHVSFVAFARDSSRIVSVDAIGAVRVWDGDSGRLLSTLKEPIKDARDAALVGDRLTIVRGGIHRDGFPRSPLAVRTFDLSKEAAGSD
ncbi:hypothetical protein [Paludisphaera sp.]|uniref:WD40 repeat domain-containing protein n=1 Tax=Paludisphaera sp. TaxID=2017432 RepID=UPI00301D79FB